MKYRIVEKSEFTVTGLVMRTTNDENQGTGCISKFWEDNAHKGNVGALESKCGPMGMLGVCFDYNPADNTFGYAVAIETPKGLVKGLPAGCREIPVPGATYAVFEAVGPIPDSIVAVWKSAYGEWFPASEYEHAGTPDFEVYSKGPDGKDKCEVWIPIRKKGSK